MTKGDGEVFHNLELGQALIEPCLEPHALPERSLALDTAASRCQAGMRPGSVSSAKTWSIGPGGVDDNVGNGAASD